MCADTNITFKYNLQIKNSAIISVLNKLTNHIYKLLPLREEGADWMQVLDTVFVEIKGMNDIFLSSQPALFSLVCKLEGLYSIDDSRKDNFLIFRKTVFECLSLLEELKNNVKK